VLPQRARQYETFYSGALSDLRNQLSADGRDKFEKALNALPLHEYFPAQPSPFFVKTDDQSRR